jgi:TRAP-type mannitol/chloroaromatic compound transport system substrate-binding protein
MAMGLHKAVGYYYYPGFHGPGSAQAVDINKESFEASDRQIIEAMAACEKARALVSSTRW